MSVQVNVDVDETPCVFFQEREVILLQEFLFQTMMLFRQTTVTVRTYTNSADAGLMLVGLLQERRNVQIIRPLSRSHRCSRG
jgi:hypothetical protein